MNIRRLVLDVDKARARPSLLEIGEAMPRCAGVQAFNVTVSEIDIETVGMDIGRLASTRLGRAVLRDVFAAALVSAACSFAGALVLLGFSLLLPRAAWLSIPLTTGLMAVFGVLLARTVHGSPLLWAGGLVLGGLGVSCIGVKLDIVG